MNLLGLFDPKNQQYYRDRYYENQMNVTNIRDLEQILVINSQNIYETEKKIAFENLELGVSEKKLLNKLGRPRFIKKVSGEGAFDIMMYKTIIANKRVVIQVNCVNNQLLLASYTYNLLTSSELSALQNETIREYIPEHVQQQFSGATNFLIKSINGTADKLYVKSNLFNIKLFYISGDESLRNKIYVGDQSCPKRFQSMK